MNRILHTALLFGVTLIGHAQGRNANWLMPGNNWLNFNSAPPTATAGGNLAVGSSSSMSDPFGTFLFRADEMGVLNAQHQLMANGPTPIPPYMPNNLPNNSSQGRIVVPKPGEPGHYVVMFNGSMDAVPGTHLAYGEVDMNLAGGLGAWVDSNLTYLTDSVKGMMSGTRHANGTDYWVVVHQEFSDRFLSYRVNSSGVDPNPVISQVGSSDTLMDGGNILQASAGQMTFSLQGDKVELNMFNGLTIFPQIMEIFNFDRSTGQLSLYTHIDSLWFANGTAFSPDGSKFYVYETDGVPQPCQPCNRWRVWQYDITDPSPTAIQASKTLLKEVGPTSGGGGYHNVLMGPDGKIYIYQSSVAPHADKLGVVNFPNLAGTACGYDEFGVQLQGGLASILPNQILLYHDSQPAWLGVQEASAIPTLSAYPNPVTEALRIVPPAGSAITGLRWLDAIGREVRRDAVAPGTGIITAERGSLAPGAYMVQALSGQRTVGQVRVVVP